MVQTLRRAVNSIVQWLSVLSTQVLLLPCLYMVVSCQFISPLTLMETRTVYTDSQFPDVELWLVGDSLQIRNGKRGRPEELRGQPEVVAEAFFRGMAYSGS